MNQDQLIKIHNLTNIIAILATFLVSCPREKTSLVDQGQTDLQGMKISK
jgi:hypothetical protein